MSLSVLLDDPDNPGAGRLLFAEEASAQGAAGATELELEKLCLGAGSQTPS